MRASSSLYRRSGFYRGSCVTKRLARFSSSREPGRPRRCWRSRILTGRSKKLKLGNLRWHSSPGSRSLPYSEYQRIGNDIGGDTAQALIEAQTELTNLTQIPWADVLTCPNRLPMPPWFRPSSSTRNASSESLADIAVREDAVCPVRGERPPRIEGYVPDVFVTDVPTTTTLIGEAKTQQDIETDHSRRQIFAFSELFVEDAAVASSF